MKHTDFLKHAAQSLFFFPHNAVYFMILSVLIQMIFMFYINEALKFKCLPLAVNGHILTHDNSSSVNHLQHRVSSARLTV
jgi:hypothetical protein